MIREGQALAATLVACLIFLTMPSCGKMGYDIVANVGGSSSEIHRSTLDLSYESKESINGSGIFFRYSHIKGFGGMDAREDTSTTKASKFSVKSQLLLKSKEGPVKFTVKAGSGVNTSYNESNITLADSAHLEIDERWPVYFIWSKKISYFGRGIRTRERYENNGDVVDSYTWSWKLSLDSRYRAYVNRSFISADISPQSVEISQRSNRSSMYNLNLKSVGSLAHLMVLKQGDGNSGDAYFSGDYTGDQKMAVKVKMDKSLIRSDDDDSDVGMECCT